ncbi:G-protein coupled receptor Mth-like [Copidosoma floridanum]|uniref:G-protein coupled receptor Mth-like n=1 Tax=Copidosoma floridanum TaxID=29053 RepID=UPI0006C96452|nr:G-protein coupled receptor Mth-like [Copidosoma floridanum]
MMITNLVSILLFTLSIASNFATKTAPCNKILSVNLENGTSLANGSILFDGLTIPPYAQYSLDGQLFGCPCMVKHCIRRCCKPGLFEDRGCHEPWGQSYGIKVPPIPEEFLHPSIKNFDDHFYVIYERECIADNAFILWITGPKKSYNEHFNVSLTGSLSHYNERNNQTSFFLYSQEQYCLAWSEAYNITKIRACTNLEEYQSIVIDNMLRWSMGISNWFSAFFCLLTFLIYSLFEDLRNLHGKTLMCYVMCLAIADVLVPFIRNNELQNALFDDTSCQVMGMI